MTTTLHTYPSRQEMNEAMRNGAKAEEIAAAINRNNEPAEIALDDELADAIIDEYERTYGEGNFPEFDVAGDEIGGRL